MFTLREALSKLSDGQGLNQEEAESAVSEVLAGGAGEAAVAAFLSALRIKGETVDELVGAVRAIRSRMISLEGVSFPVLDTCGTGGDGANTVNVSTAAAIVVAACGVAVAKHGNRAASGNSGSSEVLAELGIATEAGHTDLRRCLEEVGIAFLFAPRFHPALKSLAAVRRQLPFRTLFNLIGPLANPARPAFQLIGVAGERAADLVAGALQLLGIERAAVVTGHGGLDEVSLSGPTTVRLVERNQISLTTWTPEEFGLGRCGTEALRVSGPADSADRLRALFQGEIGPVHDIVVANAAASLWVAGRVSTLGAGAKLASEALASGAAKEKLENWRRFI